MRKNIRLLSLISVGVALAAANAYAKNLSTTADIKIRAAITLTETQKLNFGTIEKPSTNVLVQVTTAGVSGSATTATFVDNSTIRNGLYKIAGSASNSISISAANNNNVTGMSFTAIVGDYGSATNLNLLTGVANAAAPTATGTNLKVGATLSVASSVADGDYTPGFTITANYN